MGLLSFGGSKSKQQSQSTSLDYGANVSQSFSDSLAQSASTSAGQSSSTSRIAFEDIISSLYSGASGAAARAAEMAPLFAGQAAQLFTGGSQFLQALQGGAGEDFLTSRLTDTSARDAQLGALESGLGRLFRDQLNPAITGSSVAAGQLGGGRQGVAQGRAASAIAEQYQQGAASIIGQDQLARDSAAAQLMSGRTAAAGTGLGALGGLFDLAAGAQGAELAPYQALSAIIGGPTVLTDSQSTQSSEATSESIARAISEAMGFTYGTSQMTSKGSNKTLSLGFG